MKQSVFKKQPEGAKRRITRKQFARNAMLVFLCASAAVFAASTLRVALIPMGDEMDLTDNLVHAFISGVCVTGLYGCICSYRHQVAV